MSKTFCRPSASKELPSPECQGEARHPALALAVGGTRPHPMLQPSLTARGLSRAPRCFFRLEFHGAAPHPQGDLRVFQL